MVASEHGLLTTILWRLEEDGPVTYALEGSVFVAAAAAQWMRDGLRTITASSDIEALAARVVDPGGVYLVPAFTGLGAPHWDPRPRGAAGLSVGVGASMDGVAATWSLARRFDAAMDAARRSGWSRAGAVLSIEHVTGPIRAKADGMAMISARGSGRSERPRQCGGLSGAFRARLSRHLDDLGQADVLRRLGPGRATV